MLSILANKIFIIACLLTLVSCKGIIKDHDLSIGDNLITSTTSFDEKFGLPFSGNFPIIIKEVDYGAIDLAPKTQNDDFSVIVTADLSSFNSEVWDGFGPINQLPSGNSFPSWVSASELIVISIPTLTQLFSLDLLVGVDSERFYIGIDLNIQAIDQYYPEGLNISQDIKNRNSEYPYASVYAYGPRYDEDGNKVENSGITILSSFKK